MTAIKAIEFSSRNLASIYRKNANNKAWNLGIWRIKEGVYILGEHENYIERMKKEVIKINGYIISFNEYWNHWTCDHKEVGASYYPRPEEAISHATNG